MSSRPGAGAGLTGALWRVGCGRARTLLVRGSSPVWHTARTQVEWRVAVGIARVRTLTRGERGTQRVRVPLLRRRVEAARGGAGVEEQQHWSPGKPVVYGCTANLQNKTSGVRLAVQVYSN